MQKRNHTVDAFKGFLILLVVLGHVLLGTLQENVFRYVIYSFHMPTFFFISGYLIRVESLCKLSFKELLVKYWNRMLKMWLLAFFVFSVYALRDCFSLKSLLKLCVQPYYHLWFVPALFVMICVVQQLFRHSKNDCLNYCVLIGGGLLLYNFSLTEYYVNTYLSCHLIIFFVLGLLSEYISIDTNKWGGVIVVLLYLLLTLIPWYALGERDAFFNQYLKLPLVGLLCVLFFLPLMRNDAVRCGVLEFWGRNSLGIYLWHVLPIIVLKAFLPTPGAYYVVSFLLIGLGVLVTCFIVKKNRLNVV